MADQETNNQSGLTRRELLKGGAVLGGALAWGTPVVQVIGMRPALAQETSPSCPNLYCLKAEVQGGELGDFFPFTAGSGRGQGNCTSPGEDCDPNVPTAILDFLNDPANRSGTLEGTFNIKLPPVCFVADNDGAGSPDLFEGQYGAVAKCGNKGGGSPCFPGTDDGSGSGIDFECGNDTGISHIELLICCP